MMSAIIVARFPLDLDLSTLAATLNNQGVVHRFAEEQGNQCLWLADQHQLAKAQNILNGFIQGSLEPTPQPENNKITINQFSWLTHTPVTWIFIVFGVLGYAVVAMPILALYQEMTFTPIKIIGSHAKPVPWQWGELWRIITPCFIHFSVAHIVMNAAGIIQIGSTIERIWGSWLFLLLCLVTGIAGNLLQYIWTGSPLFGGLSGILFGLFTFNGVLQKLNPSKAFLLPKGMYIMLAIWLFTGFTPIFEQLFGVQMGNGAHLGGAVAGALFGITLHYILKSRAGYNSQI